MSLTDVVPLVYKAMLFIKSLWDAPKTIAILSSEAHSMANSVRVLMHEECKTLIQWLYYHRREEWDELSHIVKACHRTMADMFIFVHECTIYAAGEVYKTEAKKAEAGIHKIWNRIGRLIRHSRLLKCVKIALKDIQPLRDQVAIPMRALNIHLVSLTLVSIRYNQRLTNAPYPPTCELFEDWAVVGKTMAFKHPNFSQSSLAKPGMENKISTAAEHIVRGEICCKSCEAGCLCKLDHRRKDPHHDPCTSSKDLFRGRSFFGVVRNPDGTEEVVRRRRSRAMSHPRPLLLERVPKQQEPWLPFPPIFSASDGATA